MQRDDVGEALVQRQHVRVGRLVEAAVHAVEDGVGGLVGDDVVREAGVDAAAGHVVAGVVRRGLEVAEQQRHLLRAVEGVGLAQRVRAHRRAAGRSVLSSFGLPRFGRGRQRTGRPRARSKCSMVFIATA